MLQAIHPLIAISPTKSFLVSNNSLTKPSRSSILSTSQNPSHAKPNSYSSRKVEAIASDVTAVGSSSEEEEEEGKNDEVVEYDWTEEWYPLYLTKNVPEDAPLGLTVFDKQIVLYLDAAAQLRCYEDRCPHRYATTSFSFLSFFTFN